VNASISRRAALSALAAGAIGEGKASAHGAAIGESGLPVFSTLRGLAEATPPREIATVFVAGALVAGRGQALYRRVEREPFHLGKVQSADGAWWEIVPGDIVSVLQFGASGDGERDDAASIQAAIDYAAYADGAPRRIFIPAAHYRVDETIHVGYGDRFVTLELLGEAGFTGADKAAGIYPSFNDRPCLNVQGGRRVRLRGLTIFGVNRDHLRENYDRFGDRGRRGDWLGPALGPDSDSRHAPYAGIAIDAYAGPTPPRPYPPVRYPAFVRAACQYKRNFSSDTIIEDCRIEGFCVAVAVQPGLPPDASNGDFITYRDCSFNFNVVAIADGHSDARCNNIENSRLHFNHTAIDTLTYGPGAGNFVAEICGSSFDNVWQVLNIDVGGSKTQGPFVLKFDGCSAESVYHLGRAYGSGPGAPGLSFEGCKFEFSIKNAEFSPTVLLSCGSGVATFRNCIFQGGSGLARFDAVVDLDGLAFTHPQCDIFDTASAAGRLAKSFTGQVWANAARGVRATPGEFFDFSGSALGFATVAGFDSRAFAIGRETDAGEGGRPIPWWVETLADGRSMFPASQVPTIALDRSREAIGVGEPADAEYEIALPGGWVSRLEREGFEAAYLFGAGDIVEDQDGRVLAYVVGVARAAKSRGFSLRLRVRQLTSVRTTDSGRRWEIARPLAADAGVILFHNARRFYPFNKRALIETQRGNAVARLFPRRAAEEESASPPCVAPGDYIASSLFGAAPNERLFSRARVLEVDRFSGTITFDSPAERDFWGDCPLFVKSSGL